MNVINPKDKAPQENKADPFKAPVISAKLKEAESALAAAEARYKQAVLNEGAESAELDPLECELEAARKAVARFQLAHAGALEADELERRRQLAEHHKSEIRGCRSHLDARDKAIEAFAEHIREAIKHYLIAVERSRKAKAAIVIGKWPQGGLCEEHELRTLVEQEIARVAGAPKQLGQPCLFPGGDAGSERMKYQPGKLPPIVETIKAASVHALASLQGRGVE